eukprot:s1006_g12.t1
MCNEVGDAYILGPLTGEHWLFYDALYLPANYLERGDFTIDVMMYDLPKTVQEVFHTTEPEGSRSGNSGLQDVADFLKAEVDDYCFEGCGYSCNMHTGLSYAMVHVTPQDNCSYASFETNFGSTLNHLPEGELQETLNTLLGKVIDAFSPGRLTLTLLLDVGAIPFLGSAPFAAADARYRRSHLAERRTVHSPMSMAGWKACGLWARHRGDRSLGRDRGLWHRGWAAEDPCLGAWLRGGDNEASQKGGTRLHVYRGSGGAGESGSRGTGRGDEKGGETRGAGAHQRGVARTGRGLEEGPSLQRQHALKGPGGIGKVTGLAPIPKGTAVIVVVVISAVLLDSKAIAAALLSQKVFKGCDAELVQQIADEAVRWTPGKGHEIPVTDGMPLLIVASGSLQICVGGGPAAQAGRGGLVNQPRPVSIVSAVDGEDLDDDTKKAEEDEEDEGRQELRRQFDLPDWSLYCKRAVRDGIQTLEIFAGTESAACFEAAYKSVIAKFKALTRFAAFPGIPPEVIWMLAEHSEIQVFEKDDTILREGICGVPESMIIIESGTADVEMVMFDREILEARGCCIAKLLPGAILGDACFLESWVARPCSVVARERVQVLHISSRALLEVMACYPGMASIYMSRSRQTSVVLQQSLTRPADVLAGMKLFYGMEPGFIRLLANIAERKMNFLGDVVKEEGSTDRTLRLQEFGKVRAETEAEGCVSITDVGTVLGEKMFLGWRDRSQAALLSRV